MGKQMKMRERILLSQMRNEIRTTRDKVRGASPVITGFGLCPTFFHDPRFPVRRDCFNQYCELSEQDLDIMRLNAFERPKVHGQRLRIADQQIDDDQLQSPRGSVLCRSLQVALHAES